MGFNFTQPRLTCSTVRYVLAPLIISLQYCYLFTIVYILMSDDIIDVFYLAMSQWKLILLIQTYIPALCIDLNCLCVMA